MTGNPRTASVTADFAGWTPVLAPPFAATRVGPIAAALLRTRQLFEALRRGRRRPPGGPGGSEKRGDEPASTSSIMNDPHFWMLLIH